jgi:phosphoserine aminotransferase
MNAVFIMQDPKLEKEFLQAAEQEGMVGIKGHRSVGGFRVSLYNALPLSSVQAITSFMRSFANKKG